MSLFDNIGNGAPQSSAGSPQTQAQNPMQALQQLKADPCAFLKQSGYNVPDGMNNPQQIAQHLIQSGQITQARMQQAQQIMHRMGR